MIAITIAIGNMTQYGIMGNIEDLDKKNFIKTNAPFNIKNEGAGNSRSEPLGYAPGQFIETTLLKGWNPEVIREIKHTATPVNLKWGY